LGLSIISTVASTILLQLLLNVNLDYTHILESINTEKVNVSFLNYLKTPLPPTHGVLTVTHGDVSVLYI